jgi:Uma2 family endonuclease
MTITTSPIEHTPLLMDVSNTVLHVTPAQFDELCIHNPDLRLELTKDGELIVMPPSFGGTGKRNIRLSTQVSNWNDRTELGEAFDSSTGYDFTAIGGGKLSPDVSWIEKSRLEGIEIDDKFIPIVPDFVIELRSTSDNLKPLQAKMLEYQQLGVRLGLLINPKNRQVEIYRLGRPTELLEYPRSVSCDDVLPGFTLDIVQAGIWPEQKAETSAEKILTSEQLAHEVLLRQLQRRLGDLSSQNQSRIRALAPDRLLQLGDALLDFSDPQELEKWLLTPMD